MSQLTSRLMGESVRHRSRWPKVLAEVSQRLVGEYGIPRLGNYRDPVKEIIYILLSARTTETLYQRAHRRLFSKYRNIEELSRATRREISRCVKDAGLGAKRAGHIVRLSRQLVSDFGSRPTRNHLRSAKWT